MLSIKVTTQHALQKRKNITNIKYYYKSPNIGVNTLALLELPAPTRGISKSCLKHFIFPDYGED